MLSALLFDLGETLIHVDPKLKSSIEEDRFKDLHSYLSKSGFHFSPTYLESTYREVVESYSDDLDREVHIQKILREVLEILSVDTPLVSLEEIEKIFYRAEVQAWHSFPDAIPCLVKALEAEFSLGLVSNARSDWAVREILSKLQLKKYFKVAVTSAQVGWRKPRPEPFLEALKHIEEEPRNAAFIGDTFSTDIVGAKKLEMKAIYINRNDYPIPSAYNIEPDFSVKNLIEIVNIALNL